MTQQTCANEAERKQEEHHLHRRSSGWVGISSEGDPGLIDEPVRQEQYQLNRNYKSENLPLATRDLLD